MPPPVTLLDAPTSYAASMLHVHAAKRLPIQKVGTPCSTDPCQRATPPPWLWPCQRQPSLQPANQCMKPLTLPHLAHSFISQVLILSHVQQSYMFKHSVDRQKSQRGWGRGGTRHARGRRRLACLPLIPSAKPAEKGIQRARAPGQTFGGACIACMCCVPTQLRLAPPRAGSG